MFDKAKLFRDKHLMPTEVHNTLKLLEEQASFFKDKISITKSKISILEREKYLIESDLDEFLMDYYEKVSTIFLNGISTNENSDDLNQDLDIFHEVYKLLDDKGLNSDEGKTNIYSRKNEAHEKELKKIYRKLVKISHPDSKMGSNQGSETSGANNKSLNSMKSPRESSSTNSARSSKSSSLYSSYSGKTPDFTEINSYYKQGDIAALYRLEEEYFDNTLNDQPNLVRKVESLEVKLSKLENSLNSLSKKLDTLFDSSEYKLFIKKKYCDLRGEDFFSEIAR